MRSVFAFALVATALALPTFATARRSDLTACDLISAAKLAAILGVEHVQVVKDLPGTSAADNVSGVTHSVCNGLAWTGAAPATRSAALFAVANGRGAAFALDTWSPDEASKYVDRWKSRGFGSLITGSHVGFLVLPGLGSFKTSHVKRLFSPYQTGGDRAFGLIGNPLGLTAVRAASGTWWSNPSAAIVSIVFGDTARRPTVQQLNQIAAIAVAAFGLNPLTLKPK